MARGDGSGRASIVDVARIAGVSKQTVSNVLNERPGYTDATKQRVLEAMESLSYRPRQAARSLRSRRTMLLGFHVRAYQLDLGTGFTHTLIQTLVRAAADRGYHLLMVTDGEGGSLTPLREMANSGNVDGFILSDLRVDDPRPHILADAGVPFATFGKVPSPLPQRWVDVDNRLGMASLVRHLVERGHETFAYLGLDDNEYWTLERLEGFEKTAAELGLCVPRGAVRTGTRETLRDDARRLLARKHRPTALVTDDDAVGADVLNALHTTGLTIGKDVAVGTFGGGPMTRITDPTLTAVYIPVLEVAHRVVDRCIAAATGEDPGEEGIYVPTELIVGGSS